MRNRTLMTAAGAALSLILASGCAVYYDPYQPHSARVRVAVPTPHLVLIAGTGIRWAANLSNDVFQYNGVWYRVDGPYWYYCRTWGSTWIYTPRPPSVFLRIPTHHPRHRVVSRHPGHARYHANRLKHYGHYPKPVAHKPFRAAPAHGRYKRPGEAARPPASARRARTGPRHGTPRHGHPKDRKKKSDKERKKKSDDAAEGSRGKGRN